MKGKEGCSDEAIAFAMKDSSLGSMAGDGRGEGIAIGDYGKVCVRDGGCYGDCRSITRKGVRRCCVAVGVVVLCEGKDGVLRQLASLAWE